jgi:hypothetical protein
MMKEPAGRLRRLWMRVSVTWIDFAAVGIGGRLSITNQ